MKIKRKDSRFKIGIDFESGESIIAIYKQNNKPKIYTEKEFNEYYKSDIKKIDKFFNKICRKQHGH